MIDNRIHEIKRLHKAFLSSLPGVTMVGVGYKIIKGEQTDRPAIMVFVEEKKPLKQLVPEAIVPTKLNGIDTDVYESDEIVIFQDPTLRYRPAPGGVSIGHYKITAGTLGCAVRDKKTGKMVALSNNHVLANSNNANPGDSAFQPGPYDGGTPSINNWGMLTRFPLISMSPAVCPLAMGFCNIINLILTILGRQTRLSGNGPAPFTANVVDCALAAPNKPEYLKNDILAIGMPKTQIRTATPGLEVQKSGRTTRHTKDKVIAIDTTAKVNYGGPIAVFEHQIVAGPMSAGGDSGSLVLDMDNRPVGLLFAGSDKVTIMNEIQRVMDALEIEFLE